MLFPQHTIQTSTVGNATNRGQFAGPAVVMGTSKTLALHGHHDRVQKKQMGQKKDAELQRARDEKVGGGAAPLSFNSTL